MTRSVCHGQASCFSLVAEILLGRVVAIHLSLDNKSTVFSIFMIIIYFVRQLDALSMCSCSFLAALCFPIIVKINIVSSANMYVFVPGEEGSSF